MATKLPKHTTLFVPRSDNNGTASAHAPYNFVPLPQQVMTVSNGPANHDSYSGYSGWIDCALVTLSPTYVRGMLSEKVFKEYDKTDKAFDELSPEVQQEQARFFGVAERMMIPGSSLRGLLRQMVEMVSFGKLHYIGAEQRFFYRAVAAPKDDPLGALYKDQMGRVKAGYVEKRGEQYFVRPAKDIEGNSYIKAQDKNKFKERANVINHALGYKWLDDRAYVPQYVGVSFTWRRTPKGRIIAEKVSTPGSLANRGMMTCSGNMIESGKGKHDSPRRNHCIVLEKDAQASALPINPGVVEDYLNALTDFQQQNPPFDGRYGCLAIDRPIFYLENGKEVTAFGHSPNFRLPFTQSKEKRASNALDFVPPHLRQEQDMDFAEAIFGYVGKGDDKKESRAGRVFVGDARALNGQGDVMFSQDIITPRILGTPKPSTFQHYLTQPDEAANNRRLLKHYASRTPDETVIRGHKQYWHRGNVTREQFEYEHALGSDKRKQAKKQLTGIRPVKHGVQFKFRVQFENLSASELGALMWVLDLPEGHAHKLGMGKSLGLGSVRITPTLHVHERTSRYQSLFAGEGWQLGTAQAITGQDAKKAFEDYVLAKLVPTEMGGGEWPISLLVVLRIHELLCLLAWPIDEAARFDQTRYMTIGDRDKGELNEYKSRPVLPLPSVVAGKPPPRRVAMPSQRDLVIPANPESEIIANWRTGAVLEIRPDRRFGRLRDAETQQEYHFDTGVVAGNLPANKSTVLFVLQGNRVVALKRR